MMHAEPVFFAYPANRSLDTIVETIKQAKPDYSFTADDNIQHRFWVVNKKEQIESIIAAFEKIPATYVADGHHRTAAAALVGDDLRKENPNHSGEESYNYFLAVHFPDNQLAILDYNRVVKDLNGHTTKSFLDGLAGAFVVEKKGTAAYRPSHLHEFGMYLAGEWYALRVKPGMYDDGDAIGVLDVTILSEKVLKPLLNIHDLRTDKRIDFVGGMRGLQELERRVNSGEMTVAFALYPVSMKQLIDIADSGKIMPPKTTWFEPKLRSGLVVHTF
jgi:uncharacterized protein (DUF1015 family)